jgi:WhiB family redox-sensing transcriptional regulator
MTRRASAVASALSLTGRWAERALWAQADPDTWYPDNHAQTVAAKRICAARPVSVQWLEYALSGADTWSGITSGTWGGTTPRERCRLRQARKAATA